MLKKKKTQSSPKVINVSNKAKKQLIFSLNTHNYKVVTYFKTAPLLKLIHSVIYKLIWILASHSLI